MEEDCGSGAFVALGAVIVALALVTWS